MKLDYDSVGYMCQTDFDFELGYNNYGNTIYPSIQSLEENRGCISKEGKPGCGIVEVGITLIKVVRQEVYGDEEAGA